MITGLSITLTPVSYNLEQSRVHSNHFTKKSTLENLRKIRTIVEKDLSPASLELQSLSADKRGDYLLEHAILLKINYVSSKKLGLDENGILLSPRALAIKKMDQIIQEISSLLKGEENLISIEEDQTHFKNLPRDIINYVIFPYIEIEHFNKFAALSDRSHFIVYQLAKSLGYKGDSQCCLQFFNCMLEGWKNIVITCKCYWIMPDSLKPFLNRPFSLSQWVELKHLLKTDSALQDNLSDLLKSLARGSYLINKPTHVTINNNSVYALLLLGVDPNHMAEPTFPQTTLHLAAGSVFSDQSEVVRMLLEAGAWKAIDVKNGSGFTPLMSACSSGNDSGIKSARILIEYGADVNATTFHGRTTLDFAIDSGNADLIMLLLMRGANYKKIDHHNKGKPLFKKILSNFKKEKKLL